MRIRNLFPCPLLSTNSSTIVNGTVTPSGDGWATLSNPTSTGIWWTIQYRIPGLTPGASVHVHVGFASWSGLTSYKSMPVVVRNSSTTILTSASAYADSVDLNVTVPTDGILKLDLNGPNTSGQTVSVGDVGIYTAADWSRMQSLGLSWFSGSTMPLAS
jgi:hypothetical protein